MIADDSVPRRYERLVDALADDILGAPDADILSSQTGGAARVAAGVLRQMLQRAINRALQPPEAHRGAPAILPTWTTREDKKPR